MDIRVEQEHDQDLSRYALISFDQERETLRRHRKILLCGDIYAADALTAVEDVHCLLTEESREPVEIIISTPGGIVESGLTIMDAIDELRRAGIRVIGRVHGAAMSMGCIILQKCDERIVSPSTWLMVHGLSETGFVSGRDLQESNSNQNWMKKITDQFVELLVQRNTSKIAKYSKSTFWSKTLKSKAPLFFSADEAVEAGLADKVERIGDVNN